MSLRDVVFVSHANPEDNEFARWLTLKLAALGYRAWSDVTRLLGGEDFWNDIERAIREDTIKFIYVLSKSSNHKPGALKELRVAAATARQQELEDFIIPVRIDVLAFDDINIEIGRLNVVDFSTDGWATGLKTLGAKLQKDNIPRNERFGPGAVRQWWDNAINVQAGTAVGDEEHVSNWFRVRLPEYIYAHTLGGLSEVTPAWKFPTAIRNALLTFAPASDLAEGLGTHHVEHTVRMRTDKFLSDGSPAERNDNRNAVTYLLDKAWELFVSTKGLSGYQMANKRIAFYFDQESLPHPDVRFRGLGGKKTYRALMGFKTVVRGKRHWHFAVSAKPAIHPEPLLMLKAHVLFSDDGVILWTSQERMHRARRGQCRSWWNDDWRDRLLATMAWLSGGTNTLALPLGQTVFGYMDVQSMQFTSPVTLNEHAREAPERDERTDEEEEYEDAEDDSEESGT